MPRKRYSGKTHIGRLVAFSAQGYSVPQIARMTGLTSSQVYYRLRKETKGFPKGKHRKLKKKHPWISLKGRKFLIRPKDILVGDYTLKKVKVWILGQERKDISFAIIRIPKIETVKVYYIVRTDKLILLTARMIERIISVHHVAEGVCYYPTKTGRHL